MSKKTVTVYVDGSCFNNGKGGSFGGMGIYFPNHELAHISKVYRKDTCTNNKTELYAILTAIRYVNKHIGLKKCKLHIKSDSDYSIKSVTVWIKGWLKNKWQNSKGEPVANKDLISKIHSYVSVYNITFEHVEAHTGRKDIDSICNDKADKLAKAAANRNKQQRPTRQAGSKRTYNKPYRRNYNNNKRNYNRTPKLSDPRVKIQLVSAPK